MSNLKSQKRTMLTSVLLSSPGPLVVGIGLLMGKSSTQIADFLRRTAELLAIIVAFVIFLLTTKESGINTQKKQKLERFSNAFMGSIMCLCGVIMILIAFFSEKEDKGNVIFSLVIAVLGVVANTIFWIKYTNLNKKESNPIIAVNARLYGAKSLVDCCVTLSLLSIALFPATTFSFYFDLVGSVIVSVYLILCGIKTLAEFIPKKQL